MTVSALSRDDSFRVVAGQQLPDCRKTAAGLIPSSGFAPGKRKSLTPLIVPYYRLFEAGFLPVVIPRLDRGIQFSGECSDTSGSRGQAAGRQFQYRRGMTVTGLPQDDIY